MLLCISKEGPSASVAVGWSGFPAAERRVSPGRRPARAATPPGNTSWKTQRRLYRVWQHLDADRGKRRTIVAVAAAREHITQRYGAEFIPKEPNTFKSKKGAQDAQVAHRLWLESERLTGVTFGALSEVA